ncbi:DNA (cytosine-5-)-methyltransferase [Candidatus Saccharibacteria bacterium 32-50-10]|nr:MAG: DNA (cytosine-5-)-methyltransferase [Candidatus Saccharibacteria bacterium 32-50-10]
MKTIKVVELFAGVGGFRIGLDKAKGDKVKYSTVWANQWEPSTVKQHAAEVYVARFGEDGFSGRDIEKVIEDDFDSIPDHNLLVGGFPCQDYSVASTLKNSHGLIGKKGVLFWSIYTILKRKGDKAPDYLFLENVDRLLKSPASQRGKDFAVMLASLSDLGYAIEWRVVNAAEYGLPQRRRRVFIVGYKKGTKQYERVKKAVKSDWLISHGVLADAFPVEPSVVSREVKLEGTYAEITKNFSASKPTLSPFDNSGVMIDRVATTGRVTPLYDGSFASLGDVLIDEKDVPEEYFISDEKLPAWTYLKGAKKEERKTASGHTYHYAEGAMVFPDALDRPSRTIITGEGGIGASRFKHVVKTPSGRYRRLVPIELERLNMFPDNHTQLDGVPDGKRAFMMGNALVVGAIQRVGESLAKFI